MAKKVIKAGAYVKYDFVSDSICTIKVTSNSKNLSNGERTVGEVREILLKNPKEKYIIEKEGTCAVSEWKQFSKYLPSFGASKTDIEFLKGKMNDIELMQLLELTNTWSMYGTLNTLKLNSIQFPIELYRKNLLKKYSDHPRVETGDPEEGRVTAVPVTKSEVQPEEQSEVVSKSKSSRGNSKDNKKLSKRRNPKKLTKQDKEAIKNSQIKKLEEQEKNPTTEKTILPIKNAFGDFMTYKAITDNIRKMITSPSSGDAKADELSKRVKIKIKEFRENAEAKRVLDESRALRDKLAKDIEIANKLKEIAIRQESRTKNEIVWNAKKASGLIEPVVVDKAKSKLKAVRKDSEIRSAHDHMDTRGVRTKRTHQQEESPIRTKPLSGYREGVKVLRNSLKHGYKALDEQKQQVEAEIKAIRRAKRLAKKSGKANNTPPKVRIYPSEHPRKMVCISDGDTVYRILIDSAEKLVGDPNSKFTFVDKTEWRTARIEGRDSYRTPEFPKSQESGNNQDQNQQDQGGGQGNEGKSEGKEQGENDKPSSQDGKGKPNKSEENDKSSKSDSKGKPSKEPSPEDEAKKEKKINKLQEEREKRHRQPKPNKYKQAKEAEAAKEAKKAEESEDGKKGKKDQKPSKEDSKKESDKKGERDSNPGKGDGSSDQALPSESSSHNTGKIDLEEAARQAAAKMEEELEEAEY